jgi:hypothetical protein
VTLFPPLLRTANIVRTVPMTALNCELLQHYLEYRITLAITIHGWGVSSHNQAVRHHQMSAAQRENKKHTI